MDSERVDGQPRGSGSHHHDERLRVFQIGTGNVGAQAIRRMRGRPDLELVGVHCHSPEKVGRDVGEFTAGEPIGVVGTDSVDAILSARPDVVISCALHPDEELWARLLRAGIDVVTTSDWITGYARDTDHPRGDGRRPTDVLREAALAGGATLYGTGMNPGLLQIAGMIQTADVADIENVTLTESVDVSVHHSPATWTMLGYGLPVDTPELADRLTGRMSVFVDALHLMADCLGVSIDEVVTEVELSRATREVDLGWYHLPQGSLAGNVIRFRGMVDGVARIENHLVWRMTEHLDPPIEVKGGYVVQITGDPSIYSEHLVFPHPDVPLETPEDIAAIGMTITGMPALNALHAVHAAPPGLVTAADLPLRGLSGRMVRS